MERDFISVDTHDQSKMNTRFAAPLSIFCLQQRSSITVITFDQHHETLCKDGISQHETEMRRLNMEDEISQHGEEWAHLNI